MASIARRTGIIVTVLIGFWGTVGCSGSSANTPPSASAAKVAEDDDVAAGLVEHHRYHHHGGVTLLIAMSLDTLGISPEHKAAVDKIRTDLHARMEPARSAEQKLVNTLSEGLAAGNIDAAGVDAAVAQVTAAATAVHDASAEAVNELHALLTPPERAALVDKVEAHWAVWQKANSLKADPEHGHLATLAKELGLTQDQVNKVRASLDERLKTVQQLDPQEIATHLRAFGDAFRSEKFDSKVLTTANGANSHLAGWGAARLAHFVQALSPVLTPDQRTKFAQRLREHAAYNPNDRGES